ncbi:flavodoxin [Aureococcus anophagefferens]|nr:flavodoxin [Aureococcus anophagefferens]
MAAVFEHLGPDGRWTPYDAGTAAMLEQSRLANPNAVVRLPNLPFEIRFGSAARSAKMPSPPETGIVQVNVNNENTRVVRRTNQAGNQPQQPMMMQQAPPPMMASPPRPSQPSFLAGLWAAVEARDPTDMVAGALNEAGPEGLVTRYMDPQLRRTLVHKICAFGRLGTLQAVAAALDQRVDPTGALKAALRDTPDGEGKRGLEHAVQRGHLDVVRWFVEVTRAAPGNAAALAPPGSPVAQYLASLQQQSIPGRQLAEARALDQQLAAGQPVVVAGQPVPTQGGCANPNPDLGSLTQWLDDLDLEQYEADLRHIAGVDDVRTLACMEESQLHGLAAEVGMKYGHKIKFIDACRAVRDPTPAAAADAGVASALMAKLNTLEQGMHKIDDAQTANAAAVMEGLHHIDDTTTKTAAEVAAIRAELAKVVDATRGQTRLLMDLCSDATECPKLVWMAREKEAAVTRWLTPSSWYGKPVRVQFVCPVTMQVAKSGKDGGGYRVVLPKDWIKKWGVAVNLSLTVLRVAMQLGAASMGCYHAHVPDMTIDRARLKTADELYEEVNKGLDPATRDALEKGAPECKALSEASFQMLKGELKKEDPGLDLTGLVKVVGGSGATPAAGPDADAVPASSSSSPRSAHPPRAPPRPPTTKMPMDDVLVVYGSESNTAKTNIERIAKEWMARDGVNWKVCDVMEGNDAAALGLVHIASTYDAIVVATSSFRQGDAPANYDDFLEALYKGSVAMDPSGVRQVPLAGMQSAVLGFGDSRFDTYMNCPRLTDMLLEKCGTRRMAQRREIDVKLSKEDKATMMADWAEDVHGALQAKTKYSVPKVCEWTVPGNGQTFDKSLEYLPPPPPPEAAGPSPVVVVAALGAVLGVGYYCFA